jgi:hypothetical protein
MSSIAPLRRRIAALGVAAGLAFALSACFNPFDPRVQGTGISEPPPTPDSPSGVLRLLEWCYEHRAISEYRELFTDDYRFVFGTLDPDGNAYRDNPWIREDEIQSTTHLFLGGAANQPAATSITIFLDRNFDVRDDPRYPGGGRWHKRIRTSVILRLADPINKEVSGFANFFVVRGDSARIPSDLGLRPDSTRWFIQRHEDDTWTDPGTGTSASTAPGVEGSRPASLASFSTRASWGNLKRQYR